MDRDITGVGVFGATIELEARSIPFWDSGLVRSEEPLEGLRAASPFGDLALLARLESLLTRGIDEGGTGVGIDGGIAVGWGNTVET